MMLLLLVVPSCVAWAEIFVCNTIRNHIQIHSSTKEKRKHGRHAVAYPHITEFSYAIYCHNLRDFPCLYKLGIFTVVIGVAVSDQVVDENGYFFFWLLMLRQNDTKKIRSR